MSESKETIGLSQSPSLSANALALFDAVRVDYSLRRLVHYTGSDWRHVQSWILLTNYHRYIDQFLQWGLTQLNADTRYSHLVLPGNLVIRHGQSAAEADAIIAAIEVPAVARPSAKPRLTICCPSNAAILKAFLKP